VELLALLAWIYMHPERGIVASAVLNQDYCLRVTATVAAPTFSYPLTLKRTGRVNIRNLAQT